MNLNLRFTYVLALAALAFPYLAKAQKSSPSPPHTQRLMKFAPFIGSYSFTAHYSDESRTIAGHGALEVSLDGNGSQVNLILRSQSEGGVIEAGWLVSWDSHKRAYFVKHFKKSATESSVDQRLYQIKFKASELIFEKLGNLDADGNPALLRFRWRMASPNELRIVSEHKLKGMEKFQGFVLNAKRV